jgi:peptidyl-prolyl cis-trans isomerase SurA
MKKNQQQRTDDGPMSTLRTLFFGLALAVAPLTQTTAPAWAQTNLFAPAVRVNDKVITNFELGQRELFYQLLRAPGDIGELAMTRLIEERLQAEAAASFGVVAGEEEVSAGMEEFASRANLSTEQFLAAIAQAGVAEESFRDFVRAGILWRGVVRGRFGPRAQVTEDEIDRALALGNAGGGVRVLISEIFLPADTPERRAAAQRRAETISQITTIGAFASAARRFSAAPSRGRGGRQDWIPLGNLPPQLRGQILTLAPGQVTDPIEVPNAIALFQLRDIEETEDPSAEAVSIEFARYFIPGGRSAAALAEADKIAAQVDTCDDLYGVAKGQPEDRLLRDVLPVAEIAGDISVELAKLDENEISTALTTADGQALVFLMLCGRTLAFSEEADRDVVRANLVNQRLEAYASGYLSELRADAVIQRLE